MLVNQRLPRRGSIRQLGASTYDPECGHFRMHSRHWSSASTALATEPKSLKSTDVNVSASA